MNIHIHKENGPFYPVILSLVYLYIYTMLHATSEYVYVRMYVKNYTYFSI